MKFCGKCGAPAEDGEQFCASCGARLKAAVPTPSAQPNAGQAPAPTPAATPVPAVEAVYESKFTGGAFANYFIGLITVIVTILTLSLAYPAMACWKKRWEANHTFLNGRRLRFDGRAMQLLGKYIIWVLLSLITFGIYYIFCMKVALEKWHTKHTHFAGSPEDIEENDTTNGSVFDGSSLALFGVNLLTFLVTVITLTFGSYWAHCYKERWFCKHKTIDGARLYFDGTAMQYFGKRLGWYLLTLITFGIYSFWLIVKSKKWTVHHTKIEAGAKLPPVDINGSPVATAQANGNGEAGQAQQQTTIGIIGFVLSMASMVSLPFLCIPGIICSIVSLAKKESKKGFAIAGIIIGALELIIMIVAISFILKNLV